MVVGVPPAPRTGHLMAPCADNCVLVHGGWDPQVRHARRHLHACCALSTRCPRAHFLPQADDDSIAPFADLHVLDTGASASPPAQGFAACLSSCAPCWCGSGVGVAQAGTELRAGHCAAWLGGAPPAALHAARGAGVWRARGGRSRGAGDPHGAGGSGRHGVRSGDRVAACVLRGGRARGATRAALRFT